MQRRSRQLPLGLLGLTSMMVLSCGPDQARDLQPGTPAIARGHQEVHASPKLTSIESDVRGPNGKLAAVRCATCHSLLDTGELAESSKQLVDFHRGLQVSHGDLSCASCHRSDRPDGLHLATGAPLQMDEAITLCSQCHGPQRKSYEHGAHGGMSGHWDLRRGDRLRNQCVDCHDPHRPQIPHVTPVLPPIDRGLGAPQHSTSREEGSK